MPDPSQTQICKPTGSIFFQCIFNMVTFKNCSWSLTVCSLGKTNIVGRESVGWTSRLKPHGLSRFSFDWRRDWACIMLIGDVTFCFWCPLEHVWTLFRKFFWGKIWAIHYMIGSLKGLRTKELDLFRAVRKCKTNNFSCVPQKYGVRRLRKFSTYSWLRKLLDNAIELMPWPAHSPDPSQLRTRYCNLGHNSSEVLWTLF